MSCPGPEEIVLSTSLASYLDKKLLVLLRDGRKLLGILRSFDQFANAVLEGACERVIVGDLYCDIPLGLYVIRGENVVLIGELDLEKEELPAHMISVSATEIGKAQKAERDATAETYIFPEEKRPVTVNTCESIPVIDLEGGSEDELSKEILKAGKDFGFFQVINHGIPQQIMDDMMEVAEEFFEMPAEDKALYYSEDPRKEPRLFTGQGYGKEETLYWRDCFIMSAYPVDKFQHLFPQKPPNFKNIVSKFAPEAKRLAMTILKLISMGLGLDEDYLTGDRSGGPVKMVFNYYPRCPDPSLTLGLPKHCDPNLITLLIQGKVSGLQVLHHDQWVAVNPLPNAFVVNFGLLFEVVTNGLLKAVEHRAVTNHSVERASIALPIRSADDCVICPAEALVSEDQNPPLYGSFLFPEFFRIFATKKTDEKEIMMEDFRIKK